MRPLAVLCAGLCLIGCVGVPNGIESVKGFDVQRYMGRWYEIARLDHRFERGLTHVTAEYSLRDDGTVRVVNTGTDAASSRLKEAEGIAQFVGSPDEGHLKVSFFGPFYGSYVIFELGEEYDYAFVAGNSTAYLWLLARSPVVSDATIERFLQRAGELGFDTEKLVFVDQQHVGPAR